MWEGYVYVSPFEAIEGQGLGECVPSLLQILSAYVYRADSMSNDSGNNTRALAYQSILETVSVHTGALFSDLFENFFLCFLISEDCGQDGRGIHFVHEFVLRDLERRLGKGKNVSTKIWVCVCTRGVGDTCKIMSGLVI